MFRRFSFLFIVFIFFLSVNAQSAQDKKNTEKFLYHLYSNNYLSADSALDSLIRIPEYYLYRAQLAWWQVISGGDKEEWTKTFNISLKNFKENTPEKPDNKSTFNFIVLHSLKARLEFLNKSYLPGLSHLNNCIGYLKRSFNKEVNYHYFYLTSGLYHYFMGKAYEEHFWVRPYLALYPKADIMKGIKYLQTIENSYDISLYNEANYFLMKIYLEGEHQPHLAEFYSRKLLKKHPANLLYRYHLFKIFLEQDKPDKAAAELKELIKGSEKNAQLTQKQKEHFVLLAKENMKKYYLREK